MVNDAVAVDETSAVDDGQQFAALADFIRWQNPYAYEVELPSELASSDLIRKSGLAADNDAANPFRVPGRELTFDQHQRCEYWHVGGQVNRITKAIRIPYTFTRFGPDGKSERASAHLLIGYQGPPW